MDGVFEPNTSISEIYKNTLSEQMNELARSSTNLLVYTGVGPIGHHQHKDFMHGTVDDVGIAEHCITSLRNSGLEEAKLELVVLKMAAASSQALQCVDLLNQHQKRVKLRVIEDKHCGLKDVVFNLKDEHNPKAQYFHRSPSPQPLNLTPEPKSSLPHPNPNFETKKIKVQSADLAT